MVVSVRWALVLFVSLAVSSCGSDRRPRGVDSGGVDAGGVDAGGVDAGGVDSGGVDAGGVDARTDTGVISDSGSDTSPTDSGPSDSSSSDGGALDPALSPAAPEGEPCTTPGNMGECPGIQVCRFFDATTSRCESCGPCGNLGNSCSASSQCDILFMCYAGRCTNICPLGTSFCGPPDDCLDVGHPTHGVCDPASL